jgi:hypothetical protein
MDHAQEEKTMNGSKTIKNLEDVYELTPLQKEKLKKYLEAPGQGIFHENLLFMFEGQVDVSLFKQCWEKTAARHPILRTSFYHDGLEKPLQAVHREVELPFELLDWKDLDEARTQEKLETLMEEDRLHGYVLEKAPLMRLTLILGIQNRFIFWWRFHYLLMDGWSFTIATAEFLAFYRSSCQGNKQPELGPTYTFKEYVAWLRKRDCTAEQAFWQKYLEDFKPPKPLNMHPCPGKCLTPVRQGRLYLDIPELFAGLQKTIKENEVTLNAVFQGIYLLHISGYSGNEMDIITGAMTADRPLELVDSHSRVGLFINSLPVRFTIKPDMKFVNWIKKLQASMLEVFQYTSSSEEEIKKWCGIPENTPIFESVLIFENVPLPTDDPFADLNFKMTGHQFESRPHYPLSLFVWPGEELELKTTYDAHRFSKEAVNNFLVSMRKALENFINNPRLHVKDLM